MHVDCFYLFLYIMDESSVDVALYFVDKYPYPVMEKNIYFNVLETRLANISCKT